MIKKLKQYLYNKVIERIVRERRDVYHYPSMYKEGYIDYDANSNRVALIKEHDGKDHGKLVHIFTISYFNYRLEDILYLPDYEEKQLNLYDKENYTPTIAFSPDGSYLAVGKPSRSYNIFRTPIVFIYKLDRTRINSWRLLHEITMNDQFEPYEALTGKISFSSTGNLLILGNSDEALVVSNYQGNKTPVINLDTL